MVPVGWGSLPVHGPVLWTVDCPSGLYQCVFCRGLCVGSVPWDSSSRVPGRLAGPRLLGGSGHKERSGSAVVLSLPRDRDKKGVVRCRTLAACTLLQCDHRFRGHQGFPALAWIGKVSVGSRKLFTLCPAPPPPPLSFAGAFGHLASLVRLVPPSRLCMRSL